MTMLIKYEIFTEDITRFYMAELTLAIEAVHKLGFIHRYVHYISTLSFQYCTCFSLVHILAISGYISSSLSPAYRQDKYSRLDLNLLST
jgi:hypothetical protein